jgi:predicted RNA polymerase sigma factor
MEASDHLFRREAGRMVATLTRVLGVPNLALAEDVVQDAFCRALEVWKFRGVPENPSAWLMATAKNRALDILRRQRTARTFAPELARLLESEWTLAPAEQISAKRAADINPDCRAAHLRETDCVAGHMRLELRNVVPNCPFESSHRFAGIQPNSGR